MIQSELHIYFYDSRGIFFLEINLKLSNKSENSLKIC